MDHSHHQHMMDSAMPMPMCKMHMLWNWETIDTCIVFSSWHIHSMAQFVISCLIIVMIGISFEWLRKVQKQYDAKLCRGGTPTPGAKRSRSPSRISSSTPRLGLLPRFLRATLYSLLVFISFFVMLIFMTYNGYLIIAVVIGAFLGHYLLNSELEVDESTGGAIGSNGIACH